ncbi:MAG: hypothetical protein PUH07_08630 [Methanobrevibacter smithii]|jgi:hypothetical protein|nr:hypothetical protein [Methanobrevibacter smithii]MDD7245154.1 hypothetical protein [Methanobrevibacter smithii]DAW58852.1 MAG TPA: hypothetical protein [Caudoviricetes sp.]
MYVEGDVPYVGTTNGNANSGFFGGDGWWAIILFAMIFGWGNNGWGNNGRNSGGVTDGYILASDFSNIERKIDGVNSGICDGFYAMNTGMLNGFAGITQSVMTNGYETRNAIQSLSSQLADCCCRTQSSIQGVNYNMAMQTNAIEKSLCDGFRSIRDEITANRIEDKNAQIAAQQNEINALRLKASQEAQNAYLVNQLKPCPIPAYITCNPYQTYTGTCGTGTCGSVI